MSTMPYFRTPHEMASSYASAHIIFPSTGMQILSSMIHFIGVSLLAHFLSRRLNSTTFSNLTWPRLCVILLFIDSWIFVFTSGVLIFGVGMELSSGVCASGIFLCIVCYGSSKFLIYFFLIEKVHIVWSPTAGRKRLKSPVYILCLITVALYGVVAALMFVGNDHSFREDHACIIGLRRISSVPLLTYDLYINVFVTTLFLWPLLKSKFLNQRVQRVASRTLIAAGVALSTSAVNIAVLTILKGHELGWVCLGSCGTDVILNSFAIYWVTGGGVTTTRPSISTSVTSKGLPERQYRPSELNLKGVVLGSQRGPASPSATKGANEPENIYDYLPQRRESNFGKISLAQRPAEEPEEKPKSPKAQSPGILKSMVGIFRKEQEQEAHGVQITVTTEFEMDDRLKSTEDQTSVTGDATDEAKDDAQ